MRVQVAQQEHTLQARIDSLRKFNCQSATGNPASASPSPRHDAAARSTTGLSPIAVNPFAKAEAGAGAAPTAEVEAAPGSGALSVAAQATTPAVSPLRGVREQSQQGSVAPRGGLESSVEA